MSRSDDFRGVYEDLCALQGTCPVAMMRMHHAEMTPHSVVACVDRFTPLDWQPLLKALKIKPEGLVQVRLRCKWKRAYEQALKASKSKSNYSPFPSSLATPPCIHHPGASFDLAKSLKTLLQHGSQLARLDVSGIPLQERDVVCLADGLAASTSLLSLALQDCGLGDESLKVLSRGLRQCAPVLSVDLSYNTLTEASGPTFAAIVSAHATARRADAWMHSLRGGLSAPTEASGLQCLKIRGNGEFGDKGLAVLCEALIDDAFVTDLDLRDCGISASGAGVLLAVLRQNPHLVRVNMAGNKIGSQARKDIHQCLVENAVKGAGAAQHWRDRGGDLLADVEDGLELVEKMATLRRKTKKAVSKAKPRTSLPPEGKAGKAGKAGTLPSQPSTATSKAAHQGAEKKAKKQILQQKTGAAAKGETDALSSSAGSGATVTLEQGSEARLRHILEEEVVKRLAVEEALAELRRENSALKRGHSLRGTWLSSSGHSEGSEYDTQIASLEASLQDIQDMLDQIEGDMATSPLTTAHSSMF